MFNQGLDKRHHRRRTGQGCGGYTLVELMIALGLAAMISAGLIQIMSYSKQNFRIQTASAQMLEDGRFLDDTLNGELRRAGYKIRPWADTDLAVFEVEPDANRLVNGNNRPNIGLFAQGEYIRGASDNNGVLDGTPDSVMIRYQVDDQTTLNNTLCGNGLNYDATGLTTDNVLYVGLYVDANSVLQCNAKLKQANGVYQALAQAVPLARNVENLRILYGLDTDGDPLHTANEYVDATQVADWKIVVSARLTVVLRSADTNIALTPVQNYSVNGKSISLGRDKPGQRRLYQVFSTTMALRNKVL